MGILSHGKNWKKIENLENLNLYNKVICSHCHLEFDKSLMIEDGSDYFCCKGCQGVFHLLCDEGLDSFYEKSNNIKLTPPRENFEDSTNFNSPSFYDRFVKTNNDGFREVSLIIEGIHCSACVWLNEKALHKMDGVVEANINFTNNKATIVWADDIVKLSSIIDMIRSIGYNAFAYDASTQESYANKERKSYYLKMAVAIFASMNIMWIAVAQYAGYFSGITQDIKTILNIAEGLLATPVLFYSGWVFFRGAYYGLKTKVVNMDLLVATGAALTYVYSIYITVLQEGEAYFDSVSMIITFVLIGKFLEVLSKKNAADTLDIITKQIPSEVNIVKDDKIVTCKLDDVHVGDVIIVSSGEKVLLDGEIIKGGGSFDESNLTGESEPVYKSVGMSVVSGTTSIDADIHFKATKDFEHSTLSTLVTLLESAINKKPKIQQMANRLSEHFSSAILALSFLTFFVWWLWPHSFETSFMIGISVIIIACPCALALATPVATLVGLSLGASRGILFKEAAQIETMAKVDTLVLDKTGTITVGKPEVIKEHIYGDFDKKLLYSLVKSSTHPVARGVFEYIKKEDESIMDFDEFTQIPSLGIKAKYKNFELLGGNKKLLNDNSIDTNFSSDNTLFYFAIDKKVLAIFELSDKIKPGASELIKNLTQKGIDIIMLTGDNAKVAYSIANEVGINTVIYEQTPQNKSEYVKELHASGKTVVMVGDGVNDILALASADIGIVMGSGSDIAIEVGDVVLLDDSLRSLEDAFKISRTTFGLIKQNLFISLAYNAVTIPLAMAGYIIPLIAAISMSVSSLLVVGNSLRIRYKWNRS
ncbi:heavy metal translocating P-type ATPase [Candidatus Sulfurimonas marisnigri]|uniref:Copper-transporting ATPase n=1 Tax=Candidatus Sulfurimonas marisnigri TaxID=2740405 RepID=A0A7S7RR32_9BACT|nr:heavy metal translocating P-type ATPase [Candidatus Sulfurimonas marisnigri]QOY55213.1 heavy metal translocating P-type ATPase [Candidatus Sulfurimonas marisnigri]